ncbi:hypothetical protein MKX03_018694, partial [Papaver bracteatum]
VTGKVGNKGAPSASQTTDLKKTINAVEHSDGSPENGKGKELFDYKDAKVKGLR